MQKLSSNQKLLDALSADKVIIVDPDAVYVEGEIKIGPGTIIYPQVYLTDVEIGKNCTIGPVAEIKNSDIGDNAQIGLSAQIKRSKIGANLKMKHHSYLGDAEIGDGVNISAGVITCNSDGKNKHKTVMGDNAFIGANVNLIAPIKIGRGCFVAAGSTLSARLETGESNLIICREKKVYIKKLPTVD